MKSPLTPTTNRLSGAAWGLADIPTTAYTKEGWIYCPCDDIWRLHDGGTEIWVNFDPYLLRCTDRFLHSLRLYMIHLLRDQALDSCNNFFRRFLPVVKHAHDSRAGEPVDLITPEDIIGYRATLSGSCEYLLHAIRKRLREWVKLGYFGVEPEASQVLDEMKLKKNESGVAVLNHDPVKGPYNDEEFREICKYLLETYERGKIDIFDLSLGILCLTFGARPVSFAALRLRDFVVTQNGHGIDQYYLEIPAAKRTHGGRRTHFQRRKLTKEYGLMIQALVAEVKNRFASIAPELDPAELPLFPGANSNRGYASSSAALYFQIQACFNAGEPLICQREGLEGTPLKINIKRFRSTVGTRMAEEGKREREIAAALGQVSMASARVYVEATGKVRHRINEKIATELNPIAQYFKGELVYSATECEHGLDQSSRVRCFQGEIKGEVIGNCGKAGFCGGFVPLPCYSCRSFRPWIEAPHEEVLAWLLWDRKKKFEATGDETYAAVNDDVIKIVADVARRCRSLRGSHKTKGITA